jgi:hypothetical protein
MFTLNPPRALWALIAALLALALFMNGVAMMGAPLSWYGFIPGVAATGPFNEHFVSDVGAAYVAAAVSLAFAVGRLERTAAAPAAAFLVLHALIHLIPLLGAQRLAGIFVCQPPERTALLGEIAGVYAPALVALALTVPARWQELWPFPSRALTPLIVANERRLGVRMDYIHEMAELNWPAFVRMGKVSALATSARPEFDVRVAIWRPSPRPSAMIAANASRSISTLQPGMALREKRCRRRSTRGPRRWRLRNWGLPGGSARLSPLATRR